MDYTDLYEFNTSSGIIVPDDSSVLSGIQTKFKEIFGSEIDLSAETPVGRLIEAIAVMVKTTLGVTAQSANQFNINEATGIYLDGLAQMYNLKRIGQTHTVITVKCIFSNTATEDSKIEAGSLIMSSLNGAIFSIDSAVQCFGPMQLDDEGNMYGIGTATAINPGPIVAPPSTVTSIQSRVSQWVGVTNIDPTYIGTDIESDEAFRKRIKESRPIGTGFTDSTISSLSRLDGVNSSCILANNTNVDTVKKGILIPPHYIYVAVDCIETETLFQDIANCIATVKPIGVNMVSDNVPEATLVERTILSGYENSDSQKIYFYKAVRTAINVQIAYSVGNYVGEDIESDIKKVVAAYMDTVGVGGVVEVSMITNNLINNLNIGTGLVLIQKEGSSEPADISIQMMGYETPYSIATNISLSVINT